MPAVAIFDSFGHNARRIPIQQMPCELSRPDHILMAVFGVDNSLGQVHPPCQYLSMPELKSKKGEFLRNCIDFLFGFENKRGEQLDGWIDYAQTFNYPPQEFYAALEKELANRKYPSMQTSREDFAEGGLLSDKRVYLRMFRERLAIYTCAAPFGTDYFFSCRTIYIPALVRLWHILAALAFFAVVGRFFLQPLGLTFTIIALVALVFALAGVLRNAASSALSDLDALLLRIPVVSTFYEDWFREETYYRLDTRTLYLTQVPAIAKAIADEITAAKGVKLVRLDDPAPILVDLHKPLVLSPQPEQKA